MILLIIRWEKNIMCPSMKPNRTVSNSANYEDMTSGSPLLELISSSQFDDAEISKSNWANCKASMLIYLSLEYSAGRL